MPTVVPNTTRLTIYIKPLIDWNVPVYPNHRETDFIDKTSIETSNKG